MRTWMKTSALLASTLAIASLAWAQTGQNPPTETQMRDNAQTPQREGNVGHNVRQNQKQYYASLDRHQKGYLDNDDVSADPFLSQNYARCDANHDGRLTWEEFRTCTRNNTAEPQNQ